MIISACEQSGRSLIPRLSAPTNIGQFTQTAVDQDKGVYIFTPNTQHSLCTCKRPHNMQACFIIGPEGGLTDEEIQFVVKLGAIEVGMGPRTLRSETAAIAAITLAQSLWGDMQ